MRTYGILRLSEHRDLVGSELRWQFLDLEPHVAIALKRLFPKIYGASQWIVLADSDQVRADIQWFMIRYPLERDAKCDRTLQEGVDRIQNRLAERDRILLPSWHPPECPIFREGRAAYLYQSQDAKIAIANPSLLIGHDVGLGKTISALAALAMGAPLPAFIVVEAHLTIQWAEVIAEFTTLRVHVVRTRKPYDLPPADCYIFAYTNIIGWADVLPRLSAGKTAVFDEIQSLRRGQGSPSNRVKKGVVAKELTLATEINIGLTATPIYNYGDEMFNVMDFIQEGLLGEEWEFRREWCGNTKMVSDPDALGSYLRDTGFYLRRREDDPDVDAQNPKPNIVEWEVAYDKSAETAELDILKSLAMTVLKGSFVQRGQAARQLDMRLRQLTGVAKARSVAAYTKLVLEDAPRVLLAGWHREVYDIWKAELAAFNPVLYTGTETKIGKRRSFKQFTGGESRVMFISLRSGAGLDGMQQHCDQVIFGELDWSPEIHKQVIGRLRRPGQPNRVTAHYLHTNQGSDPPMLETLGIKANQARGIIDPGRAFDPQVRDDSRIRKLAEAVLSKMGD